jgi:hypothetical protein
VRICEFGVFAARNNDRKQKIIISHDVCSNILNVLKSVFVQFWPFKGIHPGPKHAYENRYEILRRPVYTLLIFEPWMIEVSQNCVLTFPV